MFAWVLRNYEKFSIEYFYNKTSNENLPDYDISFSVSCAVLLSTNVLVGMYSLVGVTHTKEIEADYCQGNHVIALFQKGWPFN